MAIRLRTDLTSNLWLVFASVFIAFIIWLIAKEGHLVDHTLQVQIRFERPANAEIVSTANEATVHLRLPVSQTARVNRSNCWIEINPDLIGDPSEWRSPEFQKTVRLHPSMVVLDDLPPTVQATSVEPAKVDLSFRLFTLEALVRPQTTGQPLEGFRLAGELRVEPERVTLTAAPSLLQQLPRNESGEAAVETAPIDLSGHDEYFETRAGLLLPDGVGMALGLEARVNVIVPIEELTAERTIAGVPIRVQTFSVAVQARIEPKKAAVKIEGPRSLVLRLGPEDFSVTPKEAFNEEPGAVADLALDCQFHESVGRRERESVRIAGLEPKSVHVEMVSLATPAPTPPPSTPTPKVPLLLTPVPSPTSTPMAGASGLFPPLLPPRLTPLALEQPSTSTLFEPLRPLSERLFPSRPAATSTPPPLGRFPSLSAPPDSGSGPEANTDRLTPRPGRSFQGFAGDSRPAPLPSPTVSAPTRRPVEEPPVAEPAESP